MACSARRTMTVSPLVVASAAMRSSSPRGRSNSPRSAPACSIAVRMSVSSSFSRTISPDTACETLRTVARSRCSTGAPIVPRRVGRRLCPPGGADRASIELPHLAIGAPAQVAVAGVPQVRLRDLRRIRAPRKSARSALIGERLVVDEAVGAGRADGLLVQPHRVEHRGLRCARDLGADQRGAVREVLRAMARPCFELAVVGGQRLDVLLARIRVAVGIASRRRGPARRRTRIPPSRTAAVALHCNRRARNAASRAAA